MLQSTLHIKVWGRVGPIAGLLYAALTCIYKIDFTTLTRDLLVIMPRVILLLGII